MLKKVMKLMFVGILMSFTLSSTLSADAVKGQKIIIKKLKKDCGFNGDVLAKKHTQDEWEEIQNKNGLNEEILKICPKAKPLKEKYINHVYDFLYNYASDSGNVPSC